MSPDYEYRQTVVTISVPISGAPQRSSPSLGAFRCGSAGRLSIKLSIRTPRLREQTLLLLSDGENAILSDVRVETKRTQPPPRYNEGTLVDAMQNAWRFVEDPALRERLKEAKGIGTPATRAEIIKGLKRQNLLAADGKLVLPTPAGLQLFELLRGAAPGAC